MTEYSPELLDEPHWSNCPAGGECTCRKYGVPPSALHPHGRSCLCTGCLPDTWAMGTADYASLKRVMRA